MIHTAGQQSAGLCMCWGKMLAFRRVCAVAVVGIISVLFMFPVVLHTSETKLLRDHERKSSDEISDCKSSKTAIITRMTEIVNTIGSDTAMNFTLSHTES